MEGRQADGTYEGTLEFDAIRLVDGNGSSTSLDVQKIEPGQVRLRLVIEGPKASVILTGPPTDEGTATVKLQGEYLADKNGILLEKITGFDFLRPGMKKLEMTLQGRLSGADAAKGAWKIYISCGSHRQWRGKRDGFRTCLRQVVCGLENAARPSQNSGAGTVSKPGVKR